MHARVINSKVVPGKLDDAAAIWRDKVAPGLKQAKGFKAAYLAGDRKTGNGVTITLWDSEADADAMNAALPQTLALFEGLFTAPPEVVQYEVLVQV